MKRMTRKNQNNIRSRFAEVTGVNLRGEPMRRPSFGKAVVLAAVLGACLCLAAFTLPLFSSLDGDELSLRGSYEGNGIVSIWVENYSEKPLEFQKQTKLMRWVTGEEVPRLDAEPVFENTHFEPRSKGIMTVDLTGVYDVAALEQAANGEEWYYLVLTNNGFLFGQDWMCSVNFGRTAAEKTVPEETDSPVPAEEQILEAVEKELRFYFEESYGGELMAFNEANFLYQQKVDELLTRFDGTVVSSVCPYFAVGGPVELPDPEPVLKKLPEGVILDPEVPPEQQYLLAVSDWCYTDGYGRMVATVAEKALAITAAVPQRAEQTDGGAMLPLRFLFVYPVEEAKPENYAFFYGQLYSFAQLEDRLVIRDEHYAVYDATDLIYTDVDAYLDHFLTTRSDLYCDEAVRQRIHAIHDYYADPAAIREQYGYLVIPQE